MKNIYVLTLLFCSLAAYSQQQLYIPPVISGGVYNLSLSVDSIQFVSGEKTITNGYNGNYLGPTLVLQAGEIANISVTNNLSEPTTTHWHGMHIAPENDGGPHSVIMPNQTWNPSFTVLDKAATYWYHPHLHMKTGEHVMKGAAGLIIVQDSEEAALDLPRTYGTDDFPIIVQTQQLDASNQVVVDGMRDSIIVVNGIINPYVDMPAQVVRLRILNADQERNYKFGFTNNKMFSVIGSDGGLLPIPVELTKVDSAPGERIELLLNLSGMEGQTIHLMSYASEIPMGVQGGPTMLMPSGMPMQMMNSPLNGIDYNILQINVVSQTSTPITSIPSALTTLELLSEGSENNTRQIKFTSKDNPTPMEAMDGPFFFNGNSFNMDRIDQDIELNNIEIWTLTNQTMVAHPFHIHDVQFYILDINGVPPTDDKAGRKDVVSVGPMSTVRFITQFEDFAGTTPYMYHCHNLMHEDGGMMGQFTVSNTTGIQSFNNDVDLSVIPNPTESQFIVQINEGGIEIKNIVLYDIFGKKQVELLNLNTAEAVNVLVSHLAEGQYFSVIETNKGPVLRKFIKK